MEADITLYIGLFVAVAFFVIVVIVVIFLVRRKGRDHSMYNMPASGRFESLNNICQRSAATIYLLMFIVNSQLL